MRVDIKTAKQGLFSGTEKKKEKEEEKKKRRKGTAFLDRPLSLQDPTEFNLSSCERNFSYRQTNYE